MRLHLVTPPVDVLIVTVAVITAGRHVLILVGIEAREGLGVAAEVAWSIASTTAPLVLLTVVPRAESCTSVPEK